MSQDRVMLLIDADNVSIDIMEQAVQLLHKQHGGVHVRRAYCTAESAMKHQLAFKRMGIKPMVNLAAGKNSTDIALAVDAIDLVLAERPDVVVIASSDSDFAPLVQRLREKGCEVRGIGQLGKTGQETQDVYDDYTVLEHRKSADMPAARSAARGPARKAAARKTTAAKTPAARKAASGTAAPAVARAAPELVDEPSPQPMPVAEAPVAPVLATAPAAARKAAPAKKAAARKSAARPAAAARNAAADEAFAAVLADDDASPSPALPEAAAPAEAPAKPARKRPARKSVDERVAASAASAAADAESLATPAAVPAPAPAPAANATATSRNGKANGNGNGSNKSSSVNGNNRASLDAVLQCLPELQSGQSLALNTAVRRLRDAQLLGQNSSSLKLFSSWPERFELVPQNRPSVVRLRGG